MLVNSAGHSDSCGEELLLREINGRLAELLQGLDDLQGTLTSACAGSLITLFYLGFGILAEFSKFCVDLFNKFFHGN